MFVQHEGCYLKDEWTIDIKAEGRRQHKEVFFGGRLSSWQRKCMKEPLKVDTITLSMFHKCFKTALSLKYNLVPVR